METSRAAGKILSIQRRGGPLETLTSGDTRTTPAIALKAGLLIQVSDSVGHQLHFTYDASHRINSLTDAAGGQYQYSYDSNNNLSAVTYPDSKVKSYLYNETDYTGGTSLPPALTGIVDENGSRYVR